MQNYSICHALYYNQALNMPEKRLSKKELSGQAASKASNYSIKALDLQPL